MLATNNDVHAFIPRIVTLYSVGSVLSVYSEPHRQSRRHGMFPGDMVCSLVPSVAGSCRAHLSASLHLCPLSLFFLSRTHTAAASVTTIALVTVRAVVAVEAILATSDVAFARRRYYALIAHHCPAPVAFKVAVRPAVTAKDGLVAALLALGNTVCAAKLVALVARSSATVHILCTVRACLILSCLDPPALRRFELALGGLSQKLRE